MSASVTLKVVEGPLLGREYSYERRGTLVVGSGVDCTIKLPMPSPKYLCIIRVAPPDMLVECSHDLSLVSINGQNVKRLKDRIPHGHEEEGEKNVYTLHDGDELKLSNTVFKIESKEPKPDDELLLKVIKVQQKRVEEEEAAGIKGYEIVRTLGKGGRGNIFLAKREGGDLVALKILSSAIASNSRHLDDFKREIRLTKSLKHKNILCLHEGGCSNGKYFLAHEYCPGGTVDQLMSSKGEVLGVDEAIGIMLQVLDGLDYIHNVELAMTMVLPDGSRRYRKGLLHRDICPHNIFLSGQEPSYVAVLGGFDIAVPLEISKDEVFGDIAGSVCYMTRNIFVHYDKPRKEFDIWAAAATLYNMLTGKFPRDFPEKCHDLWQMVLRNPPVPIRERNPEIPEKLASLIDEALIEDPEIRYKSVADFKKELEKVL